jgi:hypothetical protein
LSGVGDLQVTAFRNAERLKRDDVACAGHRSAS